MTELQTLEQLAGRLAHFMPLESTGISADLSGLSDTDLNTNLQSHKSAIDDDVRYLSTESPQLFQRVLRARDFDSENIAQALDFLERNHSSETRYQEARALQQEYQRRILRKGGFDDIYKLRQELESKRLDRKKLGERFFVRKKITELDVQIKALEQAAKECSDSSGVKYVHIDNRELQRITLSYAGQILRQYSAQIKQLATLQPELIGSLVQDYLQGHFVDRDGYAAQRGNQMFLRLPPDYQERVIRTATEQFKRLAYIAAGKKGIEISESQRRVAQKLFEAVQEMEKKKGSDVNYNYHEIQELKRDAQDVLQRESYDASLRRFASEGITPEVWQAFSGRKEIVDRYRADVLDGLKGEIGGIIWEKLLRNPSETGSVSAFAFTPATHAPYLVMNAWAQRTGRGESPIMGELGGVLSSYSEEEVKQIERLNVPGLVGIVKTLRISPNALGTIGMLDTPDNNAINEGLVKMCAYYLENGTPEQKYFALRTAAKLNCMILTGSDHKEKYQGQRDFLLPVMAKVLQVPVETFQSTENIRDIIQHDIAFGFYKFADLQAGRPYSRTN